MSNECIQYKIVADRVEEHPDIQRAREEIRLRKTFKSDSFPLKHKHESTLRQFPAKSINKQYNASNLRSSFLLPKYQINKELTLKRTF